uniref:Unannotated protein n=1 Tax=freshwater metagenome TaxID=449393 RepID=A0A6J7NYR8_9ZZZZ
MKYESATVSGPFEYTAPPWVIVVTPMISALACVAFPKKDEFWIELAPAPER